MSVRRRLSWRGPPLALQILALLLGGLIVAQLVTLLLTVMLPPAPAPQYGLDDIAAALAGRGAGPSAANPLERHVQPGPPDVSGAGWLVSETSRHDLAVLLGASDAQVALAFYTPLPFAGTTVARPMAALANDGPMAPRASAAFRPAALLMLDQPGGGGGVPAAPPPGMALTLPPDAALAHGSFPPGTLPNGGPLRGPGDGFRPPISLRPHEAGRSPAGGSGLYAIDPRPVEVGPRGTFIPGDGGAAVPPLLGGGTRSGASAQGTGTQGTGTQGAGAQGTGARGTGTPATSNPPALPPSIGGPPRAGDPDAPSVRPTAPGRDLLAAPLGATSLLQPIVPAPAPRAQPPQPAQPRTTLATPVPIVPVAPSIAPVYAAPLAGAPASQQAVTEPAPLPYGPPIAIAPAARGLFGLAPAPFVEGDFVAALRLPGGRWAIVQPAAAPFPNAWQRRVLLWFVLAFAIVAPFGWLFARRLVTPLGRFATAAEQLGRDPAAPILPLAGPAEIGRAANAFNLMQSRLRSFVEDRTAMIGAISHDLRTPLTRMRFRIEDTDGEVRDGLLEEVDAMEAMITQVIAFIRDASVPGVRERLDLGALVDDVVEDAQMIGKDVTIERVATPPAAVPVDVDVLGIRRVLDNLLENAVKYGVRARIRLTTEADSALAEIVDDGPGLPDDELERVFEPFYRGEIARASDKAGSGLGLAVCRSIARAHGGDVRLLNARDGFAAQIRLPLAFDRDRPLAA